MGRVIIEQHNTYGKVKTLSMKCKSEKRASEIASKLPNVNSWNYYEDNQRIPKQKKKSTPEVRMPDSFEELDMMMRTGLI